MNKSRLQWYVIHNVVVLSEDTRTHFSNQIPSRIKQLNLPLSCKQKSTPAVPEFLYGERQCECQLLTSCRLHDNTSKPGRCALQRYCVQHRSAFSVLGLPLSKSLLLAFILCGYLPSCRLSAMSLNTSSVYLCSATNSAGPGFESLFGDQLP